MKKLSLLNRIKSASAWSLLITALLSGCITEPKFPKEPKIEFESIRKINKPAIIGQVGGSARDSVIITIQFEDGDGDLGITAAQAQNDEPWKGGKLYNYEVESLVKRGDTWQEYRDPQGLKVNLSGNFIPLVESTSKPSPIEGTLDYSLVFFQNVFNPSTPNDTLRFNIIIRDRALNTSNRIETGPIVVYGNK
jgi:hypothetical protein